MAKFRLRDCAHCPLRRALAEPNPFQSLEDFEKFHNIDLGGMTPAELTRERDRLRLALLFPEFFSGRPAAWAARRLVEVERRLAGGATR
ncbi:MAG: hypothetical protein QME76_02090 [Bacillota bacterium]|nr:hypothetical protein [Bacillota bacterium]